MEMADTSRRRFIQGTGLLAGGVLAQAAAAAQQAPAGGGGGGLNPANWDGTYWHAKAMLTNLLNIEVPVISAINGPAYRHAEVPLLSDITIASDTAEFQDTAHFQGGLVPGDGVHI